MTSIRNYQFVNIVWGMIFSRNIAILSFSIIIQAIAASGQSSEDFPVPVSTKVEGIPAIKKADVDHLFFDPSETRSNLIWDVDRTKRRLLVTDEKTNIYMLEAPLAKPVQLVPDRAPYLVKINRTDGSIAFTDDHEDRDNYQLYLRTSDGTVKRLSTFTGKDESVESVVWSPDGKTLYYSQTDYDAKTSKICSHDLSVPTCYSGDLKGIWNVLDFKGDKLLLKYWKASSQQNLHIYDLRTRKLTVVDDQANSEKGFFAGDRVFWLAQGSPKCSSDPCVLSMDLKKGETRQIALPKDLAFPSDIKPSPNGKLFLIQESRNGVDNLRIVTPKGNKLIDRVKPFVRGSYVIWHTRWLSDTEVVYTIENIGRPASIESFDAGTGKHTTWTKERLPTPLIDQTRAPEVIKWKSFDSKEISGYVVRPQTVSKRSPVVIFVHGGPQTIDKPLFNLRDIRLIANLGITIIHTNIRGSSGFGNAFMDADNRVKRGDAIKDVRALIDWIGTQPDLDPERIFVHGESYGGFVALATALQEPNRVKAVIAEFPIVSIRGYLGQSWIDEFARTEYGDPKDEKLLAQLDGLSPLNNTSRWNDIPLFLTRGKRDDRTPEKDVLDLKSQLQAKGSEVWFIYDERAGHGVGGRYVAAALYQFLNTQINKNKEKQK